MDKIRISAPLMGEDEIKAVEDVLRSGNLVMGKNVAEFERQFAGYLGTSHAAATASGTTALQVGIQSLGMPEGSEVITTPFTFIASSNALLYNKLRPVFADVNEEFNIDASKIKGLITEKTKAVLVVHLFGNPCDMEEIVKVCKEHNLLLIEDCAQSVGAEYNGKKTGAFGDISCFSFYATKNMTTGEGGMIASGNSNVVEKARLIINHGQKGHYEHSVLGYNFRMAEMQAAIGKVQLSKLDRMNEKRIGNAEFFSDSLSKVEGIKLPGVSKGKKHVFHQYTLRVLGGKRNALMEDMENKGIESRIFYPKPVYMQPVYQEMGYEKGLCPVSEQFSEEVLSIPVHPGLTEKDLEKVAESVMGFFK